MPRRLCPVCIHPSQEVRDWFNAGKAVDFICQNAPVPQLWPADIEFHSRHSARKVKLADPTTVESSVEDLNHETIQSRRTELKKKLDRVSTLLDRELDNPTSQKGLKDASQEYRMFTAQLNEIDLQIAEMEAKNVEQKKVESGVGAVNNTPEYFDSIMRRVRQYKIMSEDIVCSPQEKAEVLGTLEEEFMEKQKELYPGITDAQLRPELERARRYDFYHGNKYLAPSGEEQVQ